MAARRPRDSALLDAIEALPAGPYAGPVWRIVREGRDPVQCSAVGGRWDDRTFEVLYTSTQAEGAVAEMAFHLRRGQPVVPSRVDYRLYELRVRLGACVTIPDLDALARLGLATAGFGQLSYADREREYPRTQEIAEAAYFLGRDAIVVPSARCGHANLVVFCAGAGPGAVEIVGDRGPVAWTAGPPAKPTASR